MIMTEQEIKEQIQTLLSAPEVDYSKFISLSNMLANYDKNNVRFSVDADIITRLGHELVARQETALSELVKNAYDADATKVELIFLDSKSVGGTLIINDNGCGMTREQLINGFMRISSNDKVLRPVSELYRRKRSGRKGIGRFAVQRLGEKLTIITKSSKSDLAYRVNFDWTLYKGNSDITNISNSIDVDNRTDEGTTLIISDLKDVWTEKSVQRVYRYLMGILQPLESDISMDAEKGNPGFYVQASLEENGNKVGIENDAINVKQFAVATIEGCVDNEGVGHYKIVSEQFSIDLEGAIGLSPDDENSRFDLLRNVKIHSYYFLEPCMPKSQKNAVQSYLKMQGGIRLYRNGFRVLPYAEFSNDWLSLDYSMRKRTILPQHGNANFLGFVSINDDSGDFEETSSREGLVENDSFLQLTNFAYRILVTGAVAIAQIRNVKVSSGQKKDKDGNWEVIGLRIKNISHTLDELEKTIEITNEKNISSNNKSKNAIKSIKKEILQLKKLQKEERKRNAEEKVVLRVLSSVGLTIEQFVHEVKYYLNNISSDISFLLNRLSYDADALKRTNILNDNFSTFKSYVSYFDSVVANNINRELRIIEIRDVVNPFINSLKQDALNSGIELEDAVYDGFNLYCKPMHPSEWTSILFNFYTNSKKAIKRAAAENGLIFIECGKENGFIYLEFSDNGDGIPVEIEDKIFEEFFTTSTQKDIRKLDSQNEITGSGLGLSIVRDIVKSYKGRVMVVNPKRGLSTCLRVEIPALSDNEIMNL